MTMRMLLAGGAGFIGSNFARYWATAHPEDEIVVFDALTYAGNRQSLSDLEAEGRVSFVLGDICDEEALGEVISGHRLDTIVNLAAESHNSFGVLHPRRFFMTNVVGTQALCQAAMREGVGRFHHVSTCEVYGDLSLDSPDSFDEESPYRPRTPYNASKAGGDHAVRAYVETFGLRATITNCCNNYGPYQFPEKVVPLFVTRALRSEPLPVYESSKNRREWLHVEDHCRAIEQVLLRGEIGETYHVGSGREATIDEIADAVLELTGRPSSLKRTVPDRPGHDRRYLLDSTKIRSAFGWSPQISFEAGLAATVEWYESNPGWWEPLLGKSPVNEDDWSEAVLGARES